MEQVEDAIKLLERICRGIRDSSASDGDKKYLKELLDLTAEKLNGITSDEDKDN